ncbi:aldehyde ferredoxin oxidoreductase family protein [Thermodesulfobacteriota bacterium]
MIGGYHGRLLRVDLGSRTTKIEAIPEETLAGFIGGRGLGTKILFDEQPGGVDPLGPENRLLFVTGPLNGVNAPTTCRFEVVTKSPLTGALAGANSGGHFGHDLKAAGLDALVFEGAADGPCYLYIDGDKVEIRDAGALWGRDVHETTDILLERAAGAGVACIGPSGERGGLLAAIMNEKNRAAGRGGVGAVMGSKNLKAVVVRGDEKTPVADDEKVAAARKQWQTFIGEAPLTKNDLKEYGTPVLVKIINSYGAFPSKNFREGVFVDADSISAQTFKELYYVKSRPCRGCPIACGRLTRTPEREGEGPEYETLWAFGALCGINDLEKIIHANYNCNELGLDTISTGNTIACAMELSERGLFDDETAERMRADLGRDLCFGDADAIVRLSGLIGRAEGIGEVLGAGSARLATRFGHPEIAMQVKGLEMPAYDPRGFHGMSLALATNNRGGCHLRAFLIGTEALATPFAVDRFSTQGKPALVKLFQDLTATIDSMGACVFTIFALNPGLYAELVGAVTGVPLDGDALLAAGERIWNLEKLFNLREGFSRADDTLPQRLLIDPLPAGHSKGRNPDLESLLDDYYGRRGWTNEGIPTPEKLAELGLVEEGKAAGVV